MSKKCIAIIPIVLLSFAVAFTSQAVNVKLDGFTTEKIWGSSYAEILVSSPGISNCQVDYASVSTLADYDNNILYFAFRVTVDGVINETTAHGLTININNSGPVLITREGVMSGYDTVYYSYITALAEYNITDFCVEAAIGIKHGIDTVHSIDLQFIDGNGDYSNVYAMTLPEPPTEPATTVAYTETPTEKETDYTNSKTTTVKHTTERNTTEKRTTERRTTQPRTTAEKTQRTTEMKTTLPKTEMRTEAKSQTTVKIVTVYVPVTDKTDIIKPNETESTLVENSSVVELTSYDESSNTFKIRKETAYTGVAVLVIVTFGVCAIVNMAYDNRNRKE